MFAMPGAGCSSVTRPEREEGREGEREREREREVY